MINQKALEEAKIICIVKLFSTDGDDYVGSISSGVPLKTGSRKVKTRCAGTRQGATGSR